LRFGAFVLKTLGLSSAERMAPRRVAIASAEDLSAVIEGDDPAGQAILDLDPRLVRMKGAFPLAGGWNPYGAVVLEGPEALRQYYRDFQPHSLADLYMLEPGRQGSEQPPHLLPWISDIAVHRRTSWFYGPASEEAVSLEISRIESLIRSITKHGFRPEKFGHVTGYFLRRSGEFRFVIKGGTHRAAVAAALGAVTLPVTLRPGWVGVVEEDDIATWPLVASGYIGASAARDIFGRYFDLDGFERRVSA